MAKRLSDSTKWADEWFTELPMDMKLVWLYILDMCDHAGVYKVNLKLLRFQTGTDRPEHEIIEYLKDRIYIAENKWFIPKFITFQYKNFFTSNTPAIKSAKELLLSHGIIKPTDKALPNPSVTLTQPLPNPSITIIEPLSNPSIRAKDMDMDKDIDKDMNIVMDNIQEQDEYKYENEYKGKGNTKGIAMKIIDVLIDADSDDVLYKRAVEDWKELGGINGISEIMEWDEGQKSKWNEKLNNIYHIKTM
jgi:hypothetical protein